jgi:hypothetical protein
MELLFKKNIKHIKDDVMITTTWTNLDDLIADLENYIKNTLIGDFLWCDDVDNNTHGITDGFKIWKILNKDVEKSLNKPLVKYFLSSKGKEQLKQTLKDFAIMLCEDNKINLHYNTKNNTKNSTKDNTKNKINKLWIQVYKKSLYLALKQKILDPETFAANQANTAVKQFRLHLLRK